MLTEKGKRALRRKVMSAPLDPEYPFDAELKLLRTIGIASTVMLDIGANTGRYSAVLEDLVGAENLYLFEPLPHLCRQLRQRFHKAHVFELALSDKEGAQLIRIPFINGTRLDTRATFNRHVEPGQTGFDEVEVPLRPLDEVIKTSNFQAIGFIKIDVEGHELAVLRGGMDSLVRFKPLLLIEIEARHHPFPITRIFAELEGLGYKGCYVDPVALELRETSHFVADRDQNPECLKSRDFARYLNNFFFVPETAEKDFVAKVRSFLESEKRLQK